MPPLEVEYAKAVNNNTYRMSWRQTTLSFCAQGTARLCNSGPPAAATEDVLQRRFVSH